MKTKSKLKLYLKWILAPLLLLLTHSGCGKQAYVVTESLTQAESPGFFIVPNRIDILLITDDTGSISEAYNSIASQVPTFLESLEKNGWDYHFASIPLTQAVTVSQVLASKYDPNWGDQWKAPIPGMTKAEYTGSVGSGSFRKPEDFTAFLNKSSLNNNLEGLEPGLEIMAKNLADPSLVQSGFRRQDALLAIIFIGNGEDTSGVTYCTRSDGVTTTCEDAGKPGTFNSSLEQFTKEIQASINSPAVHFFAALSNKVAVSRECLGGLARYGSRYIKLTESLKGDVIDVCSEPISSVLDKVKTRITEDKRAFRTQYIMLEKDAEPSSIIVTKIHEGSSDEILQNDPENGWTYAGRVENVPVIDSPTPMNKSSGFAIKLNGNAKLLGSDRAKVEYKPAGAKDSAG